MRDISYSEFVDKIKKDNIKNINLIYGQELYLIDYAVKALKDKIITELPELNFTVLDGTTISADTLMAACETFPMLCSKRMVIVRDFSLLKSPKKMQKNEEIEQNEENEDIKDYKEYKKVIEDLPDTTILVFVNFSDIDKRKKVFLDIKKFGDIFCFDRLKRDELVNWIKKSFKKDGCNIEAKELNYFIDICGYLDKNTQKTLYDLKNEIDKLCAIASNEKNISIEHIKVLSPKNPENDVFKLINACSAKDAPLSLKLYNELIMSGEAPLKILSMIEKQIRDLIIVFELYQLNMNAKEISAKLKLHEYAVSQRLKYVSKLTRNKLVRALNKCIEAEMNKKLRGMDENRILEMLLLDLFE